MRALPAAGVDPAPACAIRERVWSTPVTAVVVAAVVVAVVMLVTVLGVLAVLAVIVVVIVVVVVVIEGSGDGGWCKQPHRHTPSSACAVLTALDLHRTCRHWPWTVHTGGAAASMPGARGIGSSGIGSGGTIDGAAAAAVVGDGLVVTEVVDVVVGDAAGALIIAAVAAGAGAAVVAVSVADAGAPAGVAALPVTPAMRVPWAVGGPGWGCEGVDTGWAGA